MEPIQWYLALGIDELYIEGCLREAFQQLAPYTSDNLNNDDFLEFQDRFLKKLLILETEEMYLNNEITEETGVLPRWIKSWSSIFYISLRKTSTVIAAAVVMLCMITAFWLLERTQVDSSKFMGNGNFGLVDGPSLQAQFFGINGMAVNREGVVYFIDAFGRVLRKIENGTVSSLAGLQNGQGMMGFVDGSFAKARMNGAKNICFDKDGILYIAESGNKAIRKVFLK